jgi:hypothetical protein
METLANVMPMRIEVLMDGKLCGDALMSTEPFWVGIVGAVYSPWGVMVPTVLLPPGMLFTNQSTVVL